MIEPFSFAREIVWQPTLETIARSHLQKFMAAHNIQGFEELLARSTADIAWFSDAILKYLDIRFQKPYDRVVDFGSDPAWPTWCAGGKLNIVQSCVDKYADTDAANRPAIVYEREEGAVRSLTYRQLGSEVKHCANMLRSHGLKKGDSIG